MTHKTFFTSLFVFMFLPLFAHAATVSLHVLGTPVKDTPTPISVRVDTEGEMINAVEGAFLFPETLTFLRIDDGSSIMSLWPELPSYENGFISFAGVAPGGFEEGGALLFRVWVSPKQTGDPGPITWKNVQVLRNDGVGSEIKTRGSTSFVIESAPLENVSPLLLDAHPPQPFRVEIVKDPLLFEGEYVAIFGTIDKGSGVAHFEIQETSFAHPLEEKWEKTQSPVRLTDQTRSSYVFVRATDYAGNTFLARVNPKPSSWSTLFSYGIMGVLLCLVFYVFLRNRQKTL